MGRHRIPSPFPATVITALVVVVSAVLIFLLVPPLPKDRVYRHDVRAPVPIPGRSFQPVPTEEAR